MLLRRLRGWRRPLHRRWSRPLAVLLLLLLLLRVGRRSIVALTRLLPRRQRRNLPHPCRRQRARLYRLRTSPPVILIILILNVRCRRDILRRSGNGLLFLPRFLEAHALLVRHALRQLLCNLHQLRHQRSSPPSPPSLWLMQRTLMQRTRTRKMSTLKGGTSPERRSRIPRSDG